MASFSNSFADALNLGYDAATPPQAGKQDKNNKTAYQRYVEKFYGPGVTSHTDPLAIARAATGAVERGLKTGAGFLGHAVSGLLGAPRGPSSPATPANRMYSNSAIGAGLSSADGSGSGYGGPSTGANSVGSRISSDLQRDFGLSADQAAGIVGNLGHESGGFTQYQERHPTSGRGGAGWAQWTGSRRTDFENYAKQNNLHPQSYEANYGFLKKDLAGPYKGAIDAVKKANTTKDAVYAFEQTYEKANPKYVNYASRLQYANAYAPTNTNLTPAQQAAAAEAAGQATNGTATGATSGSSGSITDRGERVAAMQRDLNSRGAKLKVDGLEGPQTRAAAQQFYGSPTSVRTPSFTNTPTPPTTANNWSSLQGSPTRTVNQRQDYVPTPGFTNRQSYTSGRGDEGTIPRTGVASTPYLNNPYTPASAAPRTPYYNNPYTPQPSSYTSGRGDEGRGVPSPPSMNTRNMRVPTQSFVQTPYMNQPYTGPEWDVMPGAVQVPVVTPTARLPRARPDQPPEEAVPTLIDRLGNLVERAERALGGNRGSDSKGSSSRDGGGSRSGGGSYSGGNYGGQGGSRISEGVGGAYRNR